MAGKKIYTLGFSLPGKVFSHIEYESLESLAGAEIILIQPTIGDISCGSSYNGKPLLSEFMSDSYREFNQHWRREITLALQQGKLVIVYLVKPLEYFHYTGETEFSGTGSGRVTMKKVAPFSAYDAIPCVESVTAISGASLRKTGKTGFISPYWEEFAQVSSCEAVLRGDCRQILLQTEDGGGTAAALAGNFSGYLLFLPPIHFDEDKFIRDNEESTASPWTKEAQRFGRRLASAIINLENALH